MAAPFDTPPKKARNEYDERQYVANWAKPEYTIAQAEQAMQFGLERKPAEKRGRQEPNGQRQSAKHDAQHSQRHRMGDGQAGKTERVHCPDRPRPTDLMQHEFAQRSFRADMGHKQSRDSHLEPGAANRRAKRVIVGQLIGNRVQAADPRNGRFRERDGRAETGGRKAEFEPDQHVGQEVVIDTGRSKARPQSGRGGTAISLSAITNTSCRASTCILMRLDTLAFAP